LQPSCPEIDILKVLYCHPTFLEVTTLSRAIPLLLLCSFTVLAAEEKQLPDHNPYTSASDLARGKQLFLGHCAPCHGPEGNGGSGANLAKPTLPRGSTDPSLFRTIQDGIPGTEMPRAWEMTDHEVWQVAAFVRTLGRTVANESSTGDASRGRELARSKGRCLACHVVAGEGVTMGPELTEVGLRRSASFLRRALLDPKTSIPDNYFFVQLTTSTGQQISGFRLAEDTYSVQVRDLSGRLHSFYKSELSDLRKDRTHTPMPSFRTTLSDSEREDVVAYLLSLRGDR
jgi:putative heme-binding domain-containing protein